MPLRGRWFGGFPYVKCQKPAAVFLLFIISSTPFLGDTAEDVTVIIVKHRGRANSSLWVGFTQHVRTSTKITLFVCHHTSDHL
jgi:hypothetical protein